ncbi:MAG: hypothetical protein ACKOLA_08275, partial [Spartobacteria bacterium]
GQSPGDWRLAVRGGNWIEKTSLQKKRKKIPPAQHSPLNPAHEGENIFTSPQTPELGLKNSIGSP